MTKFRSLPKIGKLLDDKWRYRPGSYAPFHEQSSSVSRLTAGLSEFFILIQCGDRPSNKSASTIQIHAVFREEGGLRMDHAKVAFLLRYVSARAKSHAVIVLAVLAAVACSVGAQYGVKVLVDSLAGDNHGGAASAWLGFILLAALIGADNLLWRLASFIASYTFVAVTGDLRCDLFRHLTGHAPSYFADRMPGTLSSRITATSNAVYTLENMFVWNVLPPCVATFAAIMFIVTVSLRCPQCCSWSPRSWCLR